MPAGGRRSGTALTLLRRQLEQALHLGEAAQLVMPDLPYRAAERLGKRLRHDQRAVELAAGMLDAAGQVHIRADHREVEPVAGADIAAGHRALTQRRTGPQPPPAGP